RLEENASHENFMSAVFDLVSDEALFARERDRFLDSLAGLSREVPQPHRRQHRLAEVRDASAGQAEQTEQAGQAGQTGQVFNNEADTDPALPGNRQWGAQIFSRIPHSSLGEDTIAQAAIASSA